MFKIYKAQNFGGDGSWLEAKYFSNKNLAIQFTKGKSGSISDGLIWEIDVHEPINQKDLTGSADPAIIPELPRIDENNWFLGY